MRKVLELKHAAGSRTSVESFSARKMCGCSIVWSERLSRDMSNLRFDYVALHGRSRSPKTVFSGCYMSICICKM